MLTATKGHENLLVALANRKRVDGSNLCSSAGCIRCAPTMECLICILAQHSLQEVDLYSAKVRYNLDTELITNSEPITYRSVGESSKRNFLCSFGSEYSQRHVLLQKTYSYGKQICFVSITTRRCRMNILTTIRIIPNF